MLNASECPIQDMISNRDRPLIVGGLPRFARPDSQLVTASQFYEPEYDWWCQRIGTTATLDRKTWEYLYILNAITVYGGAGPGKRGISFGCGKEFIASILASEGCDILATDYVTEEDQSAGWEARGLGDVFFEEYVDRATFEEKVRFRHLDMNEIEPELGDFDFCWSTGSLEHIGSYANGLAFVENAMSYLKPGGIAVHTTEFTLTSDTVGRDHPALSFYCRADIEALALRLIKAGHKIVLNFDRGTTIADFHVDTPPFHHGRTLAAHFQSHIITSIGLIIQKGG